MSDLIEKECKYLCARGKAKRFWDEVRKWTIAVPFLAGCFLLYTVLDLTVGLSDHPVLTEFLFIALGSVGLVFFKDWSDAERERLLAPNRQRRMYEKYRSKFGYVYRELCDAMGYRRVGTRALSDSGLSQKRMLEALGVRDDARNNEERTMEFAEGVRVWKERLQDELARYGLVDHESIDFTEVYDTIEYLLEQIEHKTKDSASSKLVTLGLNINLLLKYLNVGCPG